MSEPLISVVVAVYNIADYLRPCLESIISQTYKNLEILLVNDGSTDDSLKILKEYAEKDQRIKVISQQNAGLSAVRNLGIKKSKGKYVCFIDGDDSITPDYINKLYSAILKSSADISVCGYTYVTEESREDFLPRPNAISGKEAAIRLLIAQENLDIVAWNKLYKKELFTKYNILYPLNQLYEDTLTTYKLYGASKKVAHVAEPLYLYFQRSNSIMGQSKNLTRLKVRKQAAKEAISHFGYDQDLESAANVSLLLSYFAYFDASLKNQIPDTYQAKALSWIRASSGSYKGNVYLTKKLKFYLILIKTPKAIGYRLFRKIF